MTIFVKILPLLGYYTGPTFSITPNIGVAIPDTFTKQELLAGDTINNISYTDCSTGNPVGPIAIPPNQSFCSVGTASGDDVGFLTIISFNCCP